MTEKAIEAATKSIIDDLVALFSFPVWEKLPDVVREEMRTCMRRCIDAYEREIWVPVSECPEEWKDGWALLAERPFDGDYKSDMPTFFEVRWRTDSFGFTGFLDFDGRRINIIRLRPLPTPPEAHV